MAKVAILFALVALVWLSLMTPPCQAQGTRALVAWRPVDTKDLQESPRYAPLRTATGDDREAAQKLAHKLKQYMKRAGPFPNDLDWACLAYAMGRAQTDEGKKRLLQLWLDYDEAIAQGKFDNRTRSFITSGHVPPLDPILDALRSYLDDDHVRRTLLARVDEIGRIDEPANVDLRQYRVTSRKKIEDAVLRWRIYDAPYPDRAKAHGMFLQDYFVPEAQEDVGPAVEAVLQQLSKFPVFTEPVSKERWDQVTVEHAPYRVFRLARHLKKPGIGYLHANLVVNTDIHKQGEAYWKWFVAFQCLHEHAMREKVTDEDGRLQQFLKEGAEFTRKWPDGFAGLRLAQAFYAAAYHAHIKAPQSISLEQVNRGVESKLAANDMLVIEQREQRNARVAASSTPSAK